MRLGDLSRYRISEKIIDVWRKRQGEQLLPIQSRAIRNGLLDLATDRIRPNMIVSAPTSSGKSFCAELAAVKALSRRQRAVMLFPLKSLAEEKYRLFEKTYGPLGVKCLIATGDHPENDRRLADGDYHIALIIHEKFDLALTNRLDLLKNIGLIVVDEIQMISESGRGAILERLLTKVLASEYQPEIVALSAVLAERTVEPLADWLGAVLVEETQRPCELIRGVATGGTLTYRSYNDSLDGSEPFAQSDPFDPDGPALGVLASQIKADGGRTLIFVKSRSDAINLALKLAGSLGYAPAENALQKLEREEPSFLLRSLMQVLSHGVAFHSSDLSSAQREAVEQAFIEGEVSVLCSTTTLALGVNLPADTVYLETVKYASGVYAGRPELVPISRAEFDNMTGRAGRLGHNRERPGRAIVMAESEFDSEILWDSYIAPGLRKPIESAFDSLPIEDWTLHMVVAGLAGDRDGLSKLRNQTLKARLDRSEHGGDDDYPELNTALATLQVGELITIKNTSQLAPTPVGAATACSGLAVVEALHYLRRLNGRGYPETVFGWTCLALSSPIWAPSPGMLSWYEQANNLPVKMLYRRFDHSVEEAIGLLPENYRCQPLGYRSATALKTALLLDEWCRLVPVQKLEERFRLHLGQIQSLGGTAAHLVAALASLIRASDRESAQPPLLSQHAFSLRFGLPPSFVSMHRHLSGVLQRSDFLTIHQHGIESLEEIASMSQKSLDELFNDNGKSNTVCEICNNLKEEVDMQSATIQVSAPAGPQPQLVEIDGACEADRYLVKINGFPVRLTGKSFKYLTKLAWSRVNDGSGWVYKEDIEVGFNQARYLYRMKNEIAASFKSDWPIIENNRLGYYRLHIAPDKIKLNIDALKDHPDYELRRLFEAAGGTDRVN